MLLSSQYYPPIQNPALVQQLGDIFNGAQMGDVVDTQQTSEGGGHIYTQEGTYVDDEGDTFSLSTSFYDYPSEIKRDEIDTVITDEDGRVVQVRTDYGLRTPALAIENENGANLDTLSSKGHPNEFTALNARMLQALGEEQIDGFNIPYNPDGSVQ